MSNVQEIYVSSILAQVSYINFDVVDYDRDTGEMSGMCR